MPDKYRLGAGVTALAPPEVVPDRPVPRTGGVRRWWRSWRTSLRIARRDAWRHKRQSLLVVLIILAPVAVLTTFDVYLRTSEHQDSSQWQAMVSLGTVANARVTGAFAGPVVQTPDAAYGGPVADLDLAPDDTSRAATPRTAPVLPDSWRTARLWSEPVKVADRSNGFDLTVADTQDPLISGAYLTVEGRLPTAPGEVALHSQLATGLHYDVGDSLTLQTKGRDDRPTWERSFTVVGIANGPEPGALIVPGQIKDPGPENSEWLASTPTPLNWSDVRALNQRGMVVISRQVLEDPPAFCAPTDMCGDSGPVKSLDDGNQGTLSIAAVEVTIGALVAVLALLQVALMAGPAFAVSLRRRQRDLALVSANGGTPSDLRRSVLATAIVLGLTAAALALVLGWLVVRYAYSATPNGLFARGVGWVSARIGYLISPNRYGYAVTPAPVVRPEVFVIAMVAVVAALVAAWVPARTAGRTDVIHALHGRRPAMPLEGRRAAVGFALLASGALVLGYGAASSQGLGVALGLLAYQLGIILLVPWLVTAAGRANRRLPLPLRLAARDSARHRLRSVAAICAVAAASIGACATLVATTTNTMARASFYTARAQPGVVLAYVVNPGSDGSDPRAAASYIDAVRQELSRTAPTAQLGWSEGLVGDGPDVNGTIILHLPGCSAPVTESGEQIGKVDADCRIGSMNVAHSGVRRSDAVWLSARAGSQSSAWQEILDAGGVLVLDPAAVRDDSVELVQARQEGSAARVVSSTRLPATVIDSGTIPPRVVLGAGSALPKGWRPNGAVNFAVIPGAGDDSRQLAKSLDAAIGAVSERTPGWVGDGTPTYVETGFQDDQLPLTLLLVVGTTFLALFAALSVTALSLADARRDLGTMAAVGAPPRARRTYAAASALIVAGLGCLTGVVAGVLPGWALTRTIVVGPSDNRQIPASNFFTIPWLPLLALVVVIPLITAAAAWLFTRGRIPLTRRAD